MSSSTVQAGRKGKLGWGFRNSPLPINNCNYGTSCSPDTEGELYSQLSLVLHHSQVLVCVFLLLGLLFKVFSLSALCDVWKGAASQCGSAFRGIYICTHLSMGWCLWEPAEMQPSLGPLPCSLITDIGCRLKKNWGRWWEGDDTHTHTGNLAKNLISSPPAWELNDISFSAPAKMWAY